MLDNGVTEMATSALEKYAKLKAEADKVLADAKEEALEKVNGALSDLNALGETYRLVNGTKGKRAKSDLAPRYRNPADPSQTWSGKGRMAGWMAELVEKGAKKEKFLNPDRK